MIHNVQNNGRTVRVRASERLRVHFLSLARRVAVGNRPGRNLSSATIGVTSVQPGAGCSTVAFNLAAALAGICEGNVLFVECDFGNPNIGRRLPKPAIGLSEVLKGTEAPTACIHQTSIERMYFLGCGRSDIHQSLELPFNMLHNLNTDLADGFDFIVFDLPMANDGSSCFAIAPQLDGLLIVADANDVREDLLNSAAKRCDELGLPVIGVILNKA